MILQQSELITPGYLTQQILLHASPRGYGGRGDKWAGIVAQLAAEYRCASILDYGCGQGSLVTALRAMGVPQRLSEYDPAIDGKKKIPDEPFHDLVVCTDVLEHVEKKLLTNVLQHIRSLARVAIWAVISTKESNKRLPDGRNAHILIRPADWWKRRLVKEGFTLRNPPTIVRQIREREYAVVLLP